MATQLTGESSNYPYGVDGYSYLHNYEASVVGLEGDVINDRHRNRLGDSIIQLEKDLVNAAYSYNNDTYIVCATVVINTLKPYETYSIPIHNDEVKFLLGPNSTATLEATPTPPLICQFGLRPIDHLELWSSGSNHTYAMFPSYSIKGNSINFSLSDNYTRLMSTSFWNTNQHIGKFIASTILMYTR